MAEQKLLRSVDLCGIAAISTRNSPKTAKSTNPRGSIMDLSWIHADSRTWQLQEELIAFRWLHNKERFLRLQIYYSRSNLHHVCRWTENVRTSSPVFFCHCTSNPQSYGLYVLHFKSCSSNFECLNVTLRFSDENIAPETHLSTVSGQVFTYHRFVEALKYAYAQGFSFGDSSFVPKALEVL